MNKINWKPIIGFAAIITFFVIFISASVMFLIHTDDVEFRKICITTAINNQKLDPQRAIDYCISRQNWMKEMDSKGWK